MERKSVTIHFPAELLRKAKALKGAGESFNELVVEAVDREVRRRRGWAAHRRIVARREQMRAAKAIEVDSTALIRSLREDEGRRD
ncbi:YlcI/YnfO family protein [Gloeobacter violaceus]|uniref:Gsl0891 protein n=1 Tax=Gloeobacter violaceus (strain ATCC 29082 / PCC 7421) TaxID=251221 RepID=Q7NM77_GLOVI|nr:YlcI/YnfO family protein [Gloeobacter violaceus]BAC88832.1 gsl0891 [Gloeobacter violaceus PCC 7421]